MFSQRVLLPMSLWLPKNTAGCFQPHNMSFCALGNRQPQARETLLASCPMGMVQTASLCPATREGRRQEPQRPARPTAHPHPVQQHRQPLLTWPQAPLDSARGPYSALHTAESPGLVLLLSTGRASPHLTTTCGYLHAPLCPQGLGPRPGHSATPWVASETWVGRQERFSWARWWVGDSKGHLLLTTCVVVERKQAAAVRQARPSFQAWASEESKDVTM